MAALQKNDRKAAEDFGEEWDSDDKEEKKAEEYRTNGPFVGRWIVIVQGHSNEDQTEVLEVPHNLKVINIDIAEKGQNCTLIPGHVEDAVPFITTVANTMNPNELLKAIRDRLIPQLRERDETFNFRNGDGTISTITNKYIEKSWELFTVVDKKKHNHGNIYIFDRDTETTIIMKEWLGKTVNKSQIFNFIGKLIESKEETTSYDNDILLISFGCNKFVEKISRKDKGERTIGTVGFNFSKNERALAEYEYQIATNGADVSALNLYAGKRKKTRTKKNKKRSRRF